MSMCKKKQFLLRFLFVFLLFLFYVVNSSTASGGIVYIVPLKGTIDPGQVNFLERVLLEAENEAAKAVILEIDTPGGMVDSAEKINRLLRDYSGKVYGFVRGNALSAGAYIALSTDAFFMAPNSVIGAAEPVLLGSSEAIDEKNLSAWVGKMRSAAQEQGKDPQLAEAMVRREIEIDGIVKKGELLTLTTQEAEALGFSDGTVDSRSDLLALLDFADAHIVEQNLLWSEKLASWVTSPTVATLLLTVGIAGFVIELFTAGFGVAGILSLLAFTLFFSGHILVGTAGYETVLLFVLGIILMIVEAFVPGFGVFGIGGLLALILSIVTAASSTAAGLKMLGISFLLAIVAIAIAFRYLDKRGWLRRLILSEAAKKEDGYVSAKDFSALVGKVGETLTPLRPSGTIEIEGERFDVVSEGMFIPSGIKVRVVYVEGVRIVVRPI